MADSGNSFSRAQVEKPSNRLHRFHGGLKLPGHREVSVVAPIAVAGIPPVLTLPLQQHIGEPADCLVKPGDAVFKGQLIANPIGIVSGPIHASSSGTVIAVEARPVPHPSGLPAPCVVIETDGEDRSREPDMAAMDYARAGIDDLCEYIRQAGIVGLGGAGFPTHVKLGCSKQRIELLLINAVECEPYISCDNRLLQERAAEVVEGIRILRHIVQPVQCIIAIEENMQAAEQALKLALAAADETGMTVSRVPEIYPSGGERQLIKILTGQEVPSQGFPSDVGIICQNVGTAVAVYNAVIRQQPLLSRIITVAGNGIASPKNIEALIGTPVSYLAAAAGGYTQDVERILIGGPMMGYAVHTDTVPAIKTTNCILAVSREEMPPPPPAQACIRCGKCTEVCPADLLPQQLFWYARSSNHDMAQDYGLFDCIECGCCAYVCPSHIPLVQYYRHAKTHIWQQEIQTRAADIARQRHASRQHRLARIKQERADRMARKKRALSEDGGSADAKQAAIAAAVERVKRKKELAAGVPGNMADLTAGQQALIDQVDARRSRNESTD